MSHTFVLYKTWVVSKSSLLYRYFYLIFFHAMHFDSIILLHKHSYTWIFPKSWLPQFYIISLSLPHLFSVFLLFGFFCFHFIYSLLLSLRNMYPVWCYITVTDYFPAVNKILASIPRNSQNMHAIFSLFQLKVDFLISIPVYVETCIHFPVKHG